MILEGKLEKAFFGGEIWVLVARDGAQYQLVGEVPAALDGQVVRVEGESVDGAGFSMVGPLVRVKAVRRAG